MGKLVTCPKCYAHALQAGIPVQCRYGKSRFANKVNRGTSPIANHFYVPSRKSFFRTQILPEAGFFLFLYMSKSKKIIIYIFLIITLGLFLTFLLTSNNKTEDIVSNNETPNVQKENTKELKSVPIEKVVEKGLQTILEVNGTKYEGEVNKEISVYDFMNQLRNESKITFKEKTYSGIGKFIEEINGVKSDGDNYWIYYVNGVEASIGVSNYKINPGDVVSWKYEENKY